MQNDPLSDNIPHSGLNESKVDSNEGEPDKYKPRRSQRSWKPTSEILESFVFANEIYEENNSKAMLKVLPTPMLELVMQSSDEKSYGEATSYPPRGGYDVDVTPPQRRYDVDYVYQRCSARHFWTSYEFYGQTSLVASYW